MLPWRISGVVGLGLGASLLACGPRQATPATADPERGERAAVAHGWSYSATAVPGASHGVSRLDVELCFSSEPRGVLEPINSAAVPYIDHATLARTGRHLPMTRGRISLEAVKAGDCITYQVDVSEMARREGVSRTVWTEGQSVVLRTSMWLWHPAVVPDEIDVTLELTLPQSVQSSVPFELIEGTPGDRVTKYQLPMSTYRWLGYTAFGKLGIDRFTAGSTPIEIAVLDTELESTTEGRRAWIEDAVGCSAQLFGGAFPRSHLQVLVVPVGGDGGVQFGMAGRGGGAGIYVLVGRDSPDDALLGGWTTVHEVLHHTMPFIDDAWMAEGWVSYYTELMRTRVGHRDEAEGWTKLRAAFNRGQRTRRSGTLQETSDRMHKTFAYQRVYWGGAAIGFATDVALRLDSKGDKSLDDAVIELQRCCGGASHKWSAAELLEKLDAWYGSTLFTRTAHASLAARGFPDVDAVFERLGITFVDGRAVLDDAHPNAAIRRSIMAPR